WAGSLSLVAARVLASASVSLASTLAAVLSSTVTVPPSATVALSLLAAGASFTSVTVLDTSAVPLHFPAGEPIVVRLSQVLQVKDLFSFLLRPRLWLTLFPYSTLFRSWAGSLSLVAARVLASASVSLASTLAAVLSSTVTVPPSATVALSLLAAGA